MSIVEEDEDREAKNDNVPGDINLWRGGRGRKRTYEKDRFWEAGVCFVGDTLCVVEGAT